ncbi:hypothetical protein [Streptomyces sp. TP-A0356]|uniref:hypothetical protein n=1 Tax=Streptomyces sp. TP-A0356 TaxID=1359208 RepID=UPI000A5A4A8F
MTARAYRVGSSGTAVNVVALDRLEALVRNRLKHLQHRPDALDGFMAGTGLAPGDPTSP